MLGGAHLDHRDDDQARGADARQVRPVLADPWLAALRAHHGDVDQCPGAGHIRDPVVPFDPGQRQRNQGGEAAAVRRVARPRCAGPSGAAVAVHEACPCGEPDGFRPGGGALQCGRGPHRLFHCDRRDAGTGQERAQCRHLRARHVSESPTKLHGPGNYCFSFARRKYIPLSNELPELCVLPIYIYIPIWFF